MGKTILYLAISADGFIATNDDNTDWVGDDSWESYLQFVKSCDVALVGRKTFRLMEPDEFVEGTKYYVVTRQENFDSGKIQKFSIDSRDELPEAANIAVIGGGELCGSLARLGLIDEIILDTEPVIFGSRSSLFGSYTDIVKLKLIDSKKIGKNTIQNHYSVIK